jgi:hypothetical protein
LRFNKKATIGVFLYEEIQMFNSRLLSRLGFVCFGSAKRLTRGNPEGEFVELSGARYDEI